MSMINHSEHVVLISSPLLTIVARKHSNVTLYTYIAHLVMTKTKCVYCAVRTEYNSSSFYSLKG